jgi:predicted peroxiredoxin
MNTSGRLVGVIALLLTAAVSVSGQEAQGPVSPNRDGVFVHISHGSDDPHRLLMTLQMAATMAGAQKDVIVYCDIEAVRVLTVSARDIKMEPFAPLHKLLERLKELQVTVMACPTCMKVAGLVPEDLRPGVTVADKDRFFSFTSGRILTIDY